MKKLLLTISLILGFATIAPVYANGDCYKMDGKAHTILANANAVFYVPVKKNLDTKHFICNVISNYKNNLQIRYSPHVYIPDNSILNDGNINYNVKNIHIFQKNFSIKSMGGKAIDMYNQPYIIIINGGCSLLDKNCHKNKPKQSKMIIACNIIN